MLYDNLISVVEKNYDSLVRLWIEEIKKSRHMLTYQSLSNEEVSQRGSKVFENLISWLKTGSSNIDAENYFERVGRERFKEGFSLAEINYALYLTKKVFWIFVAWKEEIIGSLEKEQMIEFTTILNNYFDLGYFYLARGYFQKLFVKLDEAESMTKEEIKNSLIKGEADSSSLDKEEIIWRKIKK